MSGITTIRRNVKNVAYNYSDAQVKVREATSNDPWGPSSSLMSEIADLTYNAMAFSDIMQMIWKRLNDHGKNWRHVYKSLVLLDYLIKTGSEKVAQQCKENIYAIQTLKVPTNLVIGLDFQHIEDNKDQGMNVREKAKQLVALLKDDERLKNERARALMAKKRFAQNNMGISSDGSTHRMNRSDTYHPDDVGYPSMDSNHDARRRSRKGMTRGTSVPNLRNSELEEARPTSSGEEELQLQIALALSQEEASKEEELRKGDDIRLQMALSESKTDTRTPHNRSSAGATGGSSVQGSSLDDLLSLNPPPRSQTAAARSSEPWAGPPASTASGGQPFDPWAPVNASPTPVQTAQNDAWSSPPSYAAATGSLQSPPTRDPWLPVGNTSGDSMSPVSQLTKSPYMQQNGDTGTQSGYDDAWNFDPLAAELPDSKNMNGVQASRRNVKTPESFLGENSALVNLDNLMGPSKPAVPGMPPSSNPFLTSSSSGSQQPNPFLAQQRPSPTINEMRARQSQQQHGGQDEWGLPQPLQPQSQQNSQQVTSTTGPSTNPFL